ncbi:helix-turn-helix domain-containing protein [Streptomyces sp. NPDC002328]|uniref:helix-turn-helix domain-containing protein n=1 Tax=Streptomyces sp. NPDC002328 TaxID=3364642 RepID=UPI00369FB7F5
MPRPTPRPRAQTRASRPGPPFNAPTARRLRAALRMTPDQVAQHLRSSYALHQVTPDLVSAWERGVATPTAPELTALARVLWCSPAELVGRPRNLREHRVARGLAAEDVSRAVGHEFLAYVRMEEDNRWRGTERQTALLADLLELTLPDLVTVTGEEARLAELLRAAVDGRPQASVRPVGRIVPLDRRLLEDALRELHRSYGELRRGSDDIGAAGTTATTGAAGDAGDPGRDFLDRIVEVFWATVQSRTG